MKMIVILSFSHPLQQYNYYHYPNSIIKNLILTVHLFVLLQ